MKFLYVRKLSEICYMSNICKLTQIKLNKWIKVQLQSSVSADFDDSLDTAPDSLSGPILQLQICRWSRSHPPGATSSQPWPSWECPFSNLISTVLSPSPWLGIQTLDAAGSQRRSICSVSLSLMLHSVLTSSHSFFTCWQRSLTSTTQSHKSAGKVNQTAVPETNQEMLHLFLRRG